jgi:hypothetical protein
MTPRIREVGLAATFNFHNLARVEYQRLTKQIQPLQGCDFFLFSPRVARGAQPWAECFNPVGIENPCRHPKHLSRYSTENVEEPPLQHQLAQARSIYRIVLCFVVACLFRCAKIAEVRGGLLRGDLGGVGAQSASIVREMTGLEARG